MQARHQDDISDVTIRNDLAQFRSLLKFLENRDYPLDPGLFRVQPPKRSAKPLPRYLPESDYGWLETSILQATQADSYHTCFDRAWFLMLAHTGIRLSELLDLRLDDVNLTKGFAMIRGGKPGRDRVVYLTSRLTNALTRYLRPDLPQNDHLFVLRGRSPSARVIQRRLKKYGQQAGVAVSPHRLRHTLATRLLNQGMSIHSLRKLLGHQHLNTTQIYARIYDETLYRQFREATAQVEKMYQAAGFCSDIPTLQMSLEEVMLKLADLPLAAQPGAVWRYSIAYEVIGHLIQVITDKPLGVFLKERIFEPLEMTDTGFFVPEEKRERFGSMYCGPEEGEISAVDKSNNSPFLSPDIAPSGGGGLVSTMSDYSHFLTFLANGGQWGDVQLLSRDTVKQMTSNQLTGGQFPVRFSDPWPGMGYGLGVGVHIGHLPNEGWPTGAFGWLGVSGVSAWVFPKESVSIIAMPQARFYFDPADAFQKLAYEAICS